MYLNCLELIRQGDLKNISCFGHPSQAYIGPLSAMWIISDGNIVAVRLLSLLLLMGFVWSISAIVRILLPTYRPVTQVLAVMAVISSSVLASNITQINGDIGILCGTTITLALLMRKEYTSAACAGVLLVFSKEIGMLIYSAMVGLFLLFDVCRSKTAMKKKVRSLRHALTLLLVPLMLLGIYLAIRVFILHQPAFFDFGGWEQEWQGKLPQMFLSFDLTSKWLWMVLAGPLALQFLWVQTSLTVIAALVLLARTAFRLPLRSKAISLHHSFLIAVLALFGMYITTRYPLFNNPRYLLFVYPLTSLLFVVGVEYLFANNFIKRTLLATIITLNLVSWTWSIDPVSRFLYGTISVGGKAMYPIASASRDRCCGHGRDQLIYNFQFLDIVSMGQMARDVALSLPSRTVITDPGNLFTFWPESFSVPDPVQREEKDVKYVSTHAAVEDPSLAQGALFVEYPHMPDGQKEALLKLFPKHEMKTLQRDGVMMEVYLLSSESE